MQSQLTHNCCTANTNIYHLAVHDTYFDAKPKMTYFGEQVNYETYSRKNSSDLVLIEYDGMVWYLINYVEIGSSPLIQFDFNRSRKF